MTNEASPTMDIKTRDAAPLAALFEARSIAIVGASDTVTRMGGGMSMRFLLDHGYAGDLYPVNPKRDEVQGHKCYPSLEAVPGPIDLAILSVPAAAILGVLDAIPDGHVRIGLVYTSGFGEQDEEGEAMEQRLLEAAQARGVRLVGPNSAGVANLWSKVVNSFSQVFDAKDLTPGPTALISQSGAFATAIMAQAQLDGIDFGYYISSGNETDLEFSDFAGHLIEQDHVGAICGYIESIKKGNAFVDMAQRASALGKPVIVLKVGASEAGAQAARSHTGALVGSDAVAQAVFDAHNVLRAEDGEDLTDLVKVFERTPPSSGRRLAVISHSGGAGVMAADAAEKLGIQVPQPSETLRRRLAEMLPAYATLKNPLDLTGGASLDAELMANCVRAMLEDDGYDAALLCVNLIWRAGEALVKAMTEVAGDIDKPVAISWVAPRPEAAEAIRKAPFPVFPDPARATRVLGRRLVYDASRRAATGDEARPVQPGDDAGLALDTVDAQSRVLTAYGVRLPREVLAADADQAAAFLAETGGPVVLKIASPDIAHRSEIGAVVTGITDAEALARAFRTIIDNSRHHHPEARLDGVLVQEMVEGGVEALIGVKRDPVFGPMVALGPGGTLVELFGDVALRPAPFGVEAARRMIAATPLASLLAGYRGGAPRDAESLAETLARVSWMAADRKDIEELDLNPVSVLEHGCVALDYKIN
jgi:acetate---CoA ligase (ADP-forming)